MGNKTNMVKGIPEDDLFGGFSSEGSKERKGLEAPNRDIISKLLEDRNYQKLNAEGKSAVPQNGHL